MQNIPRTKDPQIWIRIGEVTKSVVQDGDGESMNGAESAALQTKKDTRPLAQSNRCHTYAMVLLGALFLCTTAACKLHTHLNLHCRSFRAKQQSAPTTLADRKHRCIKCSATDLGQNGRDICARCRKPCAAGYAKNNCATSTRRTHQ